MRHWVLSFEPRAAPFIEPLMGWTGGSDMLKQVKLRFPSKEAAIAYARRQGLTFLVREPNLSKPSVRPYADRPSANARPLAA